MDRRFEDEIRYLTSNETDDRWQLVCVDVGHATTTPGTAYPPTPGLHPPGYAESLARGRVLSEYQLLFLSQGRGTLDVRGTQFTLEAGTAFLLFPGVVHSYAPDPSTGWTEYWVGFRGPSMDQLVQAGFFDVDQPVYPWGLGPRAVEEFRHLLETVRSEVPGYRLVAAGLINLLLARLVASRRTRDQAEGTAALVAQARLAFEEKLTDHQIDLAALARRLGLSASAFSTLFHQYTGLTPYQYWLNLKINKGKQLLAAGRSVKETAFALGFESEFYFSRLFKKKTGLPPSKIYRENGSNSTSP